MKQKNQLLALLVFLVFAVEGISPAVGRDVIVAIGASGEEVSCPELMEDNMAKLIETLSPKFLRKNKVKKIHFFIFNENVHKVVSLPKRKYSGSKSSKMERLSKASQRATKKIFDHLHNYAYLEIDEKRVVAKRDIVGMFADIHNFIQEEGIKNPVIIVVSTMKQTIIPQGGTNVLKDIMSQLDFGNSKVIILGKREVCNTASQSAKHLSLGRYKQFWKGLIKTKDIVYKTSY